MKDYILGLDFDGVLWDSVGECYLTLGETLLLEGTQVPQEGPIPEAFRRARWLVRTGGDFLLAYELATADPGRDFEAYTKEEFQALRDLHRDRLQAFEVKFYAQRQHLRQHQSERWLAAQAPYQAVVDQFEGLRSAFREVVLMTTKDGPSARQLLASAGIELPIWSRENGVDKGEQALDLCRQRGHQPDKILFIDDLMDNLDQVRRVGTPGFLAAWGYNTPGERQLALKDGYGVLQIDDLRGQLAVWNQS